jgi:putative NADH-flavin reductase
MALNLFVLGATGNTGAHIVDLALARGHAVTAFVRSPHKITRRDAALTVLHGDPLRVDPLAQAIRGHDAVLSALGPPARDAFRSNTLLSEAAATTVAAMSTAGVGRLAIVSAAMLFPEKGLQFVFIRWLLKHHVRDLLAMEAVVQATSLDWTIARPPRLTTKADETYCSQRDSLPGHAFTVPYRAVAAFLLDCVERREHAREIVGVARRVEAA